MSAALLPRATWTDVPRPVPKLVRLDPKAVRGFAVHYTGNPGRMGDTPSLTHTCQILEAERAYHVNGHGWSDIAYLGAVDQAGRIFDARGAAYRSAANGDQDVNSAWGALTVLVGTKDTPTPAALAAVHWWRENVWLPLFPHATAVVGHRDLHQTDCPGDALYADVRSGTFTAAGGGPTPMEEPMTAVDLTPAALNATSNEVWGTDSTFVVRLPADLDPAKYAERRLDDASKTPVISPITALTWTMQAARSADAAAHAALVELQAVRQDIATLRQDVAALRTELAAAGKTTVDPAAIAHAVRAEFAANPLT